MSTTIDQRVVEMRFDNKQFENGAKESISTLGKLKQSLNLTGASKGLESINSAAKKVDFSQMEYAATKAGFQVQDIWLKTASVLEYQVARKIVNVGKNMAKALTIDPITTGFQEYETQINATQTILANTSHNGTTIEQVNEALETLNTYADKTIYNFTEMTRNIGTFTAAGVDLKTSVDSIQGIANLAAVSGSTSQQASTAMYQLSQALAAGKVSLMDWNSVVNAGMGGKVFQDALVRTSELLKTGGKAAIESYGSFRESLTKGEWLTTEVLTETLKQFSGAYSEADLIAQGFTKEQAKEISDMAKTAEDAATKVKTFTQLWDVLKESAQSGWSQSWKIIVGDFEEAKNLLTPLADFMTGAINKMSDFRNNILRIALDNPFTDLIKKIQDVTSATETVINATKEYGDIVDKVISGKYGNGQGRWDKLTEEGYDWAKVQNLVNEKLGSSVRHTEQLAEAQKSQSKTQAKNIEQLLKLNDAELENLGFKPKEIAALRELEKRSKQTGISIEEILKNSEAISGRTLLIEGLKNVGDGLVTTFKLIKDAWLDAFPVTGDQEALASKLYDLIAGFHKFSLKLRLTDEDTGKLTETGEKLLRTFKGVFAIVDVATSILGGGFKIALKAITSILGYFNLDILDITAAVGDALVKFRDWFDSLFDVSAILDTIVPMIQTGVKEVREWINAFINLPEVQEALTRFNTALDKLKKGFGPAIGSKIQVIKDWIASFKNIPEVQQAMAKFSAVLEKIGGIDIGGNIKRMVDAFLELPFVQKILERFNTGLGDLQNTDLKDVGKNIITGLKEGLEEGVKDVVVSIINLGTRIIEAICDVLDIHSPSRVFVAIGGFIIGGLIMGLINGAGDIEGALGGIGTKIANFFGNFDWGKLFAAGTSVAILMAIKKMMDAVSAIAAPFEGLGDIFAGVGKVLDKSAKPIAKVIKNSAKVVKSFSGVLNSFSMSIKAKALKDIAIAIAILVGSIALLTLLDTKKMLISTGVLLAVVGSLALIVKLLGNMGKTGDVKIAKTVGLILSVAGAIAIMAIVAKILSGMTWEEMGKAGAGIAAFTGVIIGLIAAAKLMTGSKNVDKIGPMIIKMGLAMLIMAAVAKIIAGMTWEEMGKAGAGILAFAGIIVGFVAMSKLMTGSKNIDQIGGMIFKIGAAMLIMAAVAKIIAGMTWEEMGKAGAGILAFAGIIVGLVAMSKLMTGSKNIDKIGGMILKIGAAMLLMVWVAKIIAGMTWEEMGKAGVGLAALAGIVVGLIAATKLGGKNIDKIGTTILAIGAAMLLMTWVAKIIAGMTWGEMGKAVIGLAALAGIVAGLIAATRLAGSGKKLKNVASTILLISISVAILAGMAVVLGMLPIENLVKGVAAVAILSAMMALMIIATKNAKNCKDNLVMMAVAIAVMAASIVALSFIKPEKLIPATLAMALLMGMFALIVKAGSTMNSSMGSLIVMTVAIALLGGLLIYISKLPIESTMGASKALSILLLSLAASMTIISKFGTMSAMTIASIAVMTLVVAALGGILYLLRDMPVESTISTALAISTLLMAMSGALVILGVVGLMGPAAFIGIGALATLIVGIGGIITAIGALVTEFPQLEEFLNKGIPILEKIGYAIGSFFGNVIAGFIDSTIIDTFPKLGASLSLFMINAMPFVTGIKMVDASVVEGAGFLAAAIIALTVADLINGVVSFLSGGSSFADLGTELSMFIINATPFITGIKLIDPAAAEGAKALAEMILILTAADLINGLTSWFTGGTSFADFGAQLVPFGKAMADFSATVSGNIDAEAVTAAANAGKTMAEMQKSLYGTDGVIQWFCGEKNFETFGTQLVAFGKSMVEFSKVVSAEGAINETAITAAANAGKTMTELQSSLVGTGGVVQWFCGEKDFATFGTQLVAFGKSMVEFSKIVGAEGAINEEAITAAANAGTLMSTLQANLTPIGGVVSFFTGEKSLETFGTEIKAFGQALVDFSATVGSNISEEAVNAAANAGKIMAEIQSSIPEDKWFDGKMSLDDFGKKIKKFGEGIADYSEEVADVSPEVVSASITAANRLVALTQRVTGIDPEGINNFKAEKLGKAIKGYYDKVKDVDSGVVLSSITNAQRLINLFSKMSSVNSEGVANFQKAVDSLGKISLDGLEKSFSGGTPRMITAGVKLVDALSMGVSSRKSVVVAAGTSTIATFIETITSKFAAIANVGRNLMIQFASGINSQKSRVSQAISSSVSSAVTDTKKYYDKFYSAGKYLVSGFADGISKNSFKAAASAAAMAEEAYKSAKEKLQINSPSKLFRAIGYSVPEGFAMGIDKLGGLVKRSAVSMGDIAIGGLKNSIARIAEAVNTDIDSQPTIRPVLDLSDVEAGAGAISGLFNNRASVGVLANVGSISSMMNRNRQNGGNDDVISAIDKLSDKLNNVGNTYYTVDGITYDDGSNITDAVKSLVRAAKVERRI